MLVEGGVISRSVLPAKVMRKLSVIWKSNMNVLVRTFGVCIGRKTKDVGVAGTLLASVLTLGACGTSDVKSPFSSDVEASSVEVSSVEVSTVVQSDDYTLISQNLLDALSQYPRLNPHLATVQISPPTNRFEQQVHNDLTQRGYKLKTIDNDNVAGALAAGNVVDAKIQASDADAPLYILSIGEISAERQFSLLDGQTVPVSEMVMRGDDERAIALNDKDVFGAEDELYSKVAFEPRTNTVIDNIFEPREQSELLGEEVPKPSVPDASGIVKRNIYETLQSNYASLLDEYDEVQQDILVFPSDSMRLGDTNKRTIEEYVAKMNPDTDVLSVIGCSHGQTNISNGNSLLALGRANRVKEAFLFSGVDHDKVFEEGCWAPESFGNYMPARGVVLTLKRRRDT